MCFYLLPIPLLSENIRVGIRIFFPDFSYSVDPLEVWINQDLNSLIYDTPGGLCAARLFLAVHIVTGCMAGGRCVYSSDPTQKLPAYEADYEIHCILFCPAY